MEVKEEVPSQHSSPYYEEVDFSKSSSTPVYEEVLPRRTSTAGCNVSMEPVQNKQQKIDHTKDDDIVYHITNCPAYGYLQNSSSSS